MEPANNSEGTPQLRPSRRTVGKPLAVPLGEACQLGGFGLTTCYELLKDGRLESVTIGRRRLVLYASLERLLQPDNVPA